MEIAFILIFAIMEEQDLDALLYWNADRRVKSAFGADFGCSRHGDTVDKRDIPRLCR